MSRREGHSLMSEGTACEHAHKMPCCPCALGQPVGSASAGIMFWTDMVSALPSTLGSKDLLESAAAIRMFPARSTKARSPDSQERHTQSLTVLRSRRPCDIRAAAGRAAPSNPNSSRTSLMTCSSLKANMVPSGRPVKATERHASARPGNAFHATAQKRPSRVVAASPSTLHTPHG